MTYLQSIVETRNSKRVMNLGSTHYIADKAVKAATAAGKRRRGGGKQQGPGAEAGDECSDDSADTTGQGVDGQPLSPRPARKKASRRKATSRDSASSVPVESAERGKMVAGQMYNPLDPVLEEERARARDLLSGECPMREYAI